MAFLIITIIHKPIYWLLVSASIFMFTSNKLYLF